MSVTLREMTKDEFAAFWQWSIRQQAQELAHQQHITAEAACKAAAEELSQMLPQGQSTPGKRLFSVVEAHSGECVGFLWTLHEETNGVKQSFLCDFAIWEGKRRRGYGEAALCMAQLLEAQAGCRESVLFVSNDNAGARALYEKCGYAFLRAHGYGSYMRKQL